MTKEEFYEINRAGQLPRIVDKELIDRILDDFERRICANCRYLCTSEKSGSFGQYKDYSCYKRVSSSVHPRFDIHFGCNKFEEKDK
jgi:hypothetical protein